MENTKTEYFGTIPLVNNHNTEKLGKEWCYETTQLTKSMLNRDAGDNFSVTGVRFCVIFGPFSDLGQKSIGLHLSVIFS